MVSAQHNNPNMNNQYNNQYNPNINNLYATNQGSNYNYNQNPTNTTSTYNYNNINKTTHNFTLQDPNSN